MVEQKSRFFYGIIFLIVLALFSICKTLYIKHINNEPDPVYKNENQSYYDN